MMIERPIEPTKIFYCYAHEDKDLRDKLAAHLSPLERPKQIKPWYDREIPPGTKWETEIDDHLNTTDIVLLLISSDFMKSDYCYSKEMQRALERQREGTCHVIPVILRPVFLKGTPVSELQQLPSEGKAVTSWSNIDAAFEDVVAGIFRIIEQTRKSDEVRIKKKEAERAQKAEEEVVAERNRRDSNKQRREELLKRKAASRQVSDIHKEIGSSENRDTPDQQDLYSQNLPSYKNNVPTRNNANIFPLPLEPTQTDEIEDEDEFPDISDFPTDDFFEDKDKLPDISDDPTDDFFEDKDEFSNLSDVRPSRIPPRSTRSPANDFENEDEDWVPPISNTPVPRPLNRVSPPSKSTGDDEFAIRPSRNARSIPRNETIIPPPTSSVRRNLPARGVRSAVQRPTSARQTGLSKRHLFKRVLYIIGILILLICYLLWLFGINLDWLYWLAGAGAIFLGWLIA